MAGAPAAIPAPAADALGAFAAPAAQMQAMQVQLAVVEGNVAALQGLPQQVAALQVQMAALVLQLPGMAGGVGPLFDRIAAARRENAHDLDGVAYTVVPCADGAAPANWPVGFDRDQLRGAPVAVIDALLGDYGLPHGPPRPVIERRNALAVHIGTGRL